MNNQEAIKTIILKVDKTIINVCDKISQELESEGINSNIADNIRAITELIPVRANLEYIVSPPIKMHSEHLNDDMISKRL